MSLLVLPMGCTSESTVQGEDMGHGYSRKGGHVYFEGKRIDQEVPHDLDVMETILRRKLIIPRNMDATSFETLNSKYSRDKAKVYYRWSRGNNFWVVEMTGADPATFEVLGTSLGKDQHRVWKQDSKIAGSDAGSTRVLDNSGRVWKDKNHAWFSGNKIRGADPSTFEALGDGFHYRDANRVYWIFNVVKVVEGADPRTFKPNEP